MQFFQAHARDYLALIIWSDSCLKQAPAFYRGRQEVNKNGFKGEKKSSQYFQWGLSRNYSGEDLSILFYGKSQICSGFVMI